MNLSHTQENISRPTGILNPQLIRIEDIAHALSMICRGNGHVKTFWSVGQHCICCARGAAVNPRTVRNRMVLACLAS